MEEHQVSTDDGYILSLVRIPPKNKDKKKVVLLQHGLLDSAFTWFSNRRDQSLGFILADNGFDVWASNSRGNAYSLKHKSLKPSQKEFWNFTWDDMAKYDLPALINYVVTKAQVDKIGYIGHSQVRNCLGILLNILY